MTRTKENGVISEGLYQTQKEFFGVGARHELGDILEKMGPSGVFLVTGKQSFDHLEGQFHLRKLLGSRHIVQFSDFSPNPKLEDIEKGIALFEQSGADIVVAIGGGSVIDTAKAINALSAQDGDPQSYVRGKRKVEQKGKPFIAVPTTSGTGSESTHFAVVYINGVKYSLAHPSILPDVAIVDPELTIDLPPQITSTAGLDGFCQALESFWSNRSTDESQSYARESLQLLLKNLPAAVNKPSLGNRTAVSKGAHLAGKAINISFTTASHAISYPITSRFGVAHGHAVALTLPKMLVYNSEVTDQDVQDERGVEYVKKAVGELVGLLGGATPQEAAEKITELMRQVGAPTRLGDVGVKSDEDIAYIIDNGFNPQRVKNNPRALTRETLDNILRSIL